MPLPRRLNEPDRTALQGPGECRELRVRLRQSSRWWFFVVAGAAVLLCTSRASRGDEAPPDLRSLVLQVRLEGQTISPVISRFLRRAIQEAEEQQAQCLVVMLDTPGGLVDSTRVIVRDILGSRVPVVIYVAPSGARAASAGVFITLSGHVAAMAPGTTIGAAHPVQLGGLPAGPDEDEDPPREDPDPETDADDDDERQSRRTARRTPAEEKIVSDTVAWSRALAELRERNVEWAERAVRESITATDREALEQGVVDLAATDVDDLLAKIDGRRIELPHTTVTLRTADVREIRSIEMWWGENILSYISNPNIAFLLMMLGFYGILFELYSPGWGVAGILGIVSLVLAFFGLAVLPINYVGLILIAVGLALFAAEVFVTSFGALTVGGIVCLVMGALMLVDSPAGFARVSLAVVIPVAAATAGITLFLVSSVVGAHRKQVQTGGEGLTGKSAEAVGEFSEEQGRYTGTVRVRGELWRGTSSTPVAAGQVLRVRDRDGLTLFVEPEEEKTEGEKQ